MSVDQMTFGDYSFPSTSDGPQRSHQILVAPQPSLYHTSSLAADLASFAIDAPGMSSESPSHFPSTQDYPSAAHIPFLDTSTSAFSFPQNPPHGMYVGASAPSWPNGAYPMADPALAHASRSAAFLQGLQAVIDSTHTTQQQLAAAHPGSGNALAQVTGALSGSLDPTTGVFQRTMPHPRLRTAHACDPCRKRKAKVRTISSVFWICAHGVVCTIVLGRPTVRSVPPPRPHLHLLRGALARPQQEKVQHDQVLVLPW